MRTRCGGLAAENSGQLLRRDVGIGGANSGISRAYDGGAHGYRTLIFGKDVVPVADGAVCRRGISAVVGVPAAIGLPGRGLICNSVEETWPGRTMDRRSSVPARAAGMSLGRVRGQGWPSGARERVAPSRRLWPCAV